jgi:hypothetical protein
VDACPYQLVVRCYVFGNTLTGPGGICSLGEQSGLQNLYGPDQASLVQAVTDHRNTWVRSGSPTTASD